MFKSLTPPDPYGRKYSERLEDELIGNHPSHQRWNTSDAEYLSTLPALRAPQESIGLILHSLRTGLTVVAYNLKQHGASIQVVDGSHTYAPSGYALSMSLEELVSCPQRSFGEPSQPSLFDRLSIRRQINPEQGTAVDVDYELLGRQIPRVSPIEGVSLKDYLGSLPLLRYVHSSRGKVLHIHHLASTVVPIRDKARNMMDAVVISSPSAPTGAVIEVSADEVRTAELLPLGAVPEPNV